MKQFLYLDNDIVASIIAQSEKGLITGITNQSENGSSEEQQTKLGAKGDGGINGGLLKLLQGNVSIGVEGQTETSNILQASSKEIIEKTLHDASFDIAFSYIIPTKADSSKDDIGDYIELKRVFSFVDLEYLESMFSENGVMGFVKKQEAKKLEDKVESAREGYNREQWRKVSADIKKQLKKTLEENGKQYDDAGEIISLIRGLVPYSRMLISYDGYLIPLDNKYFRIDPANLGFKYGGEITCVGLITNIIGESTDPGHGGDLFSSIQFSVNEALRKILPTTDKDLCVVHPIAVYYGE